MKNNIPDRFELLIKLPSDRFIKTISDHITPSGSFFFKKGKSFYGKISNTNFTLFRQKKYSHLDINTTQFKGEITGDSESTWIKVHFSQIWIYRYFALLVVPILILFNYVGFRLHSIKNVSDLTIILGIEVAVIVIPWIHYKILFKRDKRRFMDIFQSLFGDLEIK